jgi:glutamate synthase domain-containing protein 3
LAEAQPTIETGTPLHLTLPINNTDQAIGTTLAQAIVERHGEQGLPDGTIRATFHGSAGQRFGAFNTSGLNLTLVGQANDYVGQEMEGGQIVIRPSLKSQLAVGNNNVAGDSVLDGATGGSLFVAGQAGERFAMRNRGAVAVVEGIGNHGCKSMTNGIVVILGPTGDNFADHMTGGLAFVLDEAHHMPSRINPETVQLVRVTHEADVELLKCLTVRHVRLTGSTHGQAILDNWSSRLGLFWKVAPKGTVGSTGVRPEIQVSLPALGLS